MSAVAAPARAATGAISLGERAEEGAPRQRNEAVEKDCAAGSGVHNRFDRLWCCRSNRGRVKQKRSFWTVVAPGSAKILVQNDSFSRGKVATLFPRLRPEKVAPAGAIENLGGRV